MSRSAKCGYWRPGGSASRSAGSRRASYAVQDLCTHDDGPLGEGTLVDGQIQCPRHGARFDVKTGAVGRMPAIVPIRVYPVKVEGEDVLVQI